MLIVGQFFQSKFDIDISNAKKIELNKKLTVNIIGSKEFFNSNIFAEMKYSQISPPNYFYIQPLFFGNACEQMLLLPILSSLLMSKTPFPMEAR